MVSVRELFLTAKKADREGEGCRAVTWTAQRRMVGVLLLLTGFAL